MAAPAAPHRPRRSRPVRGQALVELGIVVTLLVVLVMGILEFGRAWMIANMITHAARDGARAAAVAPESNRDASGYILDTSGIRALVLEQIGNVMDSSTITGVVVSQTTIGGVPMVRVTVTGSVPYIFHLVGTGFEVSRVVSFRDEGR